MKKWLLWLVLAVIVMGGGLISAWQLIEVHQVNARLTARVRELEGRNLAMLATLQVTPTPTATWTPTSTATDTPTVTPTFTPIPTYTPYPTPTSGPDPEAEFLLGADLMCQYANYVMSTFTAGQWIVGNCRIIIQKIEDNDWYGRDELRKTATPKPTRPSATPEPSSLGFES